MDDKRIINKIGYDQLTDRFVGFCLPLKEEIKSEFDCQAVAKYAHCIMAQPIDVASLSSCSEPITPTHQIL